jgi:hypothetical protein
MKRLWPYLLLNVVVSAATMLIVLLIWNASHGPTAAVNRPAGYGTQNPTATPAPTQTLPALDDKLFSIEAVIGSGDLNNEYIHIVYLGDDPIDLRDWKVLGGTRTVFTFPAFLLYKGGAFDLYTRSGVDTAIDLYIGQTNPLWASGEMIRIKDPQGNERLKYTIP